MGASNTRDRTNGVAGPYWLDTDHTGGFHVCGANGKHIRFYPKEQEDAANHDVRLLQRQYIAAERGLRDAAPALLAALKSLCGLSPEDEGKPFGERIDAALAAIAQAEGKN